MDSSSFMKRRAVWSLLILDNLNFTGRNLAHAPEEFISV
jgi:hypothetical protein